MSGLQDACWFTVSVLWRVLWVAEGQLKKSFRVIWVLFGNQFA